MRAKNGRPMVPRASTSRTARIGVWKRKFSCTMSGTPAAAQAATIARQSAIVGANGFCTSPGRDGRPSARPGPGGSAWWSPRRRSRAPPRQASRARRSNGAARRTRAPPRPPWPRRDRRPPPARRLRPRGLARRRRWFCARSRSRSPRPSACPPPSKASLPRWHQAPPKSSFGEGERNRSTSIAARRLQPAGRDPVRTGP